MSKRADGVEVEVRRTAPGKVHISQQPMTISIAKISSPTDDEWDFIWSACAYSTYFHSREWAEIWGGYTSGAIRPDPKLILFSDGTRALLPLSAWTSRRGLLKRYESSPAGTFGGWISPDQLTTAHAGALAAYLTQEIGELVWRMNPYDHLAFTCGVVATKDDVTHTLNLEPGFDSIYRTWTKGHRSAVGKADREGVLVRVASTLDDWRAYYLAYQDSLRRWGPKATSHYGCSLFDEMFRRASPDITLWLAIYQDIVVAGALTFHAKQHVVYWHGAALESFLHLRPVHLILHCAIRDACEKGAAWFDFNPSGGHRGVRAFKESFGTQVLSCPLVCTERTLTTYARQVRRLFRL
jgi:hypothetical protein